MLYLVAEDGYYYSEVEKEKIKNKYNKKNILVFPEMSTIIEKLSQEDEFCVLSPIEPHQLDRRLLGNSIFEVEYLKNYYYPFTKKQIELKMDKDKILSNKLGIQITTSSVTFKDYGGSAEKLIDEAKKIEYRFLLNLSPKGFFVVGIPGTGKSFFAKCYAGETNRKLVEFNISKIKESPNPMEKIQMLLAYFKQTPGKYLLWMDEIEKQFADESTTDILGVFLTELNEFQSGQSNVFFIATANNIDRLSNDYPELLRPGGRFDKLIYLLPSKEEDTASIFQLYINEKIKHFKNSMLMSILLKSMFDGQGEYPLKADIVSETRIDDIAKFVNEHKKDTLNFLKEQIYPLVKLYNGESENIFNKNIDYIHRKQIEEIQNNPTITQDEIYPVILKTLRDLVTINANKSYALKSLIEKVLDKYGFSLPIKESIAIINNKYREKSVESSRFPYTPSEIKNFVDVVYIEYYLSQITRDYSLHQILEMILKDIIPIQVQFQQGIKKMSTQGENFLKI